MSRTAQSAVSSFFFRWKKKTFHKRNPTKNKNWAFPQELCHRFSLAEIIAATEGFNYKLHIGDGAVASVYKGYINGTIVAIKRLAQHNSLQPVLSAFKKEVLLFCQLRHPNLVSFIGFCEEQGECILVYEYMPNGDLSDYLFIHDSLSWKQRLNICIGAARAAHYLHTGVKHPIIHRDIKSLNILLDDSFVPKLSAFGMSKMGRPPTLSNAPIKVDSTVAGTIGYVDPEYMNSGQLKEKSDVFSFGMVLFEVLCGKCAREFQRYEGRETLLDIMDPFLIGKIAPDCLKKFMDIAWRCVRPTGAERPTMGEVEVELEFARELQERANASKESEASTSIGSADEYYTYEGITFLAINDIFFWFWETHGSSFSNSTNYVLIFEGTQSIHLKWFLMSIHCSTTNEERLLATEQRSE